MNFQPATQSLSRNPGMWNPARTVAIPFMILVAGLAYLDYAWTVPADRAAARSPKSMENPLCDQPEAIMAGRKLFMKNCSGCHGKEGRGLKKAKNLRLPEIQGAPAGMLFDWIRNGNLPSGMPAWSHLPDQRIWQLVTYVQTLGADPATGHQ